MKLMTPELEAEFAKVGRQEDKWDPLVVAKFFNPCGAQTWYATEYDPETHICFGFVTLGDAECSEWGYFSLDELQDIEGPIGLGIERDLHCGIRKASSYSEIKIYKPSEEEDNA